MTIKFHLISWVSLIAGLVVGMFAQKSRMCFIGGWRDFFLIRDTYLLKGFFAFLIAAAVLFFVLDANGVYLKNYPWFEQRAIIGEELYSDINYHPCEMSMDTYIALRNAADVDAAANIEGIVIGSFVVSTKLLLSFLAALLIGIFSTFANGCPMRQHVMAGSGNISAFGYLAGFYAGVIVYQYLLPYLP